MPTQKRIIIATRKSVLALWQANYVKAELQKHHPHLEVDLLTRTTEGDRKQSVALNAIGGKGLFVKELQSAVLEKEADIAVHSLKDLSCLPHPNLALAAVCERADPRDVFLTRDHTPFAKLPSDSIIGTASPRREAQLKLKRPDLRYQLLRGNIDTRIKKLEEGLYDGIILAAAGLGRLNLLHRVSEFFKTSLLLPAIGQGAIGVECRREDNTILHLLAPLQHTPTFLCVTAERAFNRRLGGDCFTPIAAYATVKTKDTLTLTAWLGSLQNDTHFTTHIEGPLHEPETLGITAAENLLQQGAGKILSDPLA